MGLTLRFFLLLNPVGDSYNKILHEILSRELRQLGLIEVFNYSDCEIFITLNHNRGLYRKFKKSNSVAKTYLIRSEPRAVYPIQYTSKIENKYDRIWTFGTIKRSEVGNQILEWPYLISPNPLQPQSNDSFPKKSQPIKGKDIYDKWKHREYLISMVASNKVSPTRHSNYEIRRKIIRNIGPNNITVHGGLWRAPLSRKLAYRLSVVKYCLSNFYVPNIFIVFKDIFTKYPENYVEIRDKYEVLNKSKFSIVIENDSNYVSEKLFDALYSKTIPIYLGPSLINYKIDPNVVIELPAELNDLFSIIRNMPESEIIDKLTRGQKFIQSSDFIVNWNRNNVYKKLCQEIVEFGRR